MSAALELLGGLVCEDGSTWAEQAAPFQHADAQAVLAASDAGPRRHFIVRPRGASKTTDAAAMALSLLISEAPRRSRSYIYAVDADQSGELLDALVGFVTRTPGLAGAVELGARTVTVKASGASLNVEASDAASAWSKRPWLLIIDEFTSWPATSNHQRLWSAVASSLPKRPDSRLVVLSMAGAPTHPAVKIWKLAQSSADWRASSVRGPTPWWSEADIEATRQLLTPAEFSRYVLADWVEVDSALSSAEDVAACVRTAPLVLPAQDAARYVAALDIGTRRDLSALAVAHTENRSAGRTVIVDRIVSWRPGGGFGGRVDLADVERTCARVCREYRARLMFDRSQAEMLVQNLARQGIRTHEYVFSQAGANRLAKALFIGLRDRAIEIPDDAELISELQTARMVETGPGTVKLVDPAGTHDDLAVAVGMTVVELTDRLDGLPALFAGQVAASRSVLPARSLPWSAQLRDTARPPQWGRAVAEPAMASAELSERERWAAVVAGRRANQ